MDLPLPAVPTSSSDEADVRRARAGSVAAFEELYRSHVGRVHGMCRRLSGDPGLAEELTQEVFVRAWTKLEGFRGEAEFATWLYRLAINVILGDRRSRGRWRWRLVAVADEGVPEPRAPRRSTALALDLERAIAAWPRKARWVFVLHEIEGLRHEEIGDLVGIAVGTSKAHLHRARALLREALS